MIKPRRTVIASIRVEWLLAGILAVGFVFVVGKAYAQQPAPTQQDYEIASYRQLLAEANARLATASAKLQMLEEAAKRKAADDEAAKKKEAP